MKIIVFDLDGTLALDDHRVHHLRGPSKNWSAYFSACDADAPNWPVIEAYEALHGNPMTVVEVWTGRIDSYRHATELWFDSHGLHQPDRLLMRPAANRTDDNELKKAWLHEARARGDTVQLVFEDRQRVVDMWRAEGIVCAQVAPGDF